MSIPIHFLYVQSVFKTVPKAALVNPPFATTPLCLVDFFVSVMYVAGYVGFEPLYKIDSLVC